MGELALVGDMTGDAGDGGGVALSVLDLAVVGDGSDVGRALRESIALARVADRLGYRRFWVAEHHNMPGIASSATAVLMGHIAQATTSIRVGSGGIMLPNHAPLMVAEQFGTLEALHPGRIDLGLGRAPGTDQVTAVALRRTAEALAADDFPQQLGELLAFFDGGFPDSHPFRAITAVPGYGQRPELWLLGSSGFSAQLAGMLGVPFSFAHHFSADNTLPALALYRSHFRPSSTLAAPHAMVAVSVICAETDERAQWLAGPSRLAFVRLRSGRPGRLPTPEEAAARDYSASEQLILDGRSTGQIVGSPETVRAALEALGRETQADELMITAMIHGYDDRVRSYELVAELARSTPAGAATVGPEPAGLAQRAVVRE
ncbi:MAG TPA: LLM class flavin-dependent oxidoreductase [Acidimicrobiales bacterium]|nr:LLM class flavin-dependent oxidoreductase [Acidimicrobiales bacterium]